MFCAQEIIISFFYVRAAYQYLQSRFNTKKSRVRSAMCLLLFTQIIIIALDITIIVLDLAGYLRLKVFIHSFVYSIKLELEFVVLNQLIEISRMGLPGIPSISHVAMDARMSRQTEETRKPRENIVGQGVLTSWSTTRDTDDDLEACKSHESDSTLDFITKP
jgi:hypothetical protein